MKSTESKSNWSLHPHRESLVESCVNRKASGDRKYQKIAFMVEGVRQRRKSVADLKARPVLMAQRASPVFLEEGALANTLQPAAGVPWGRGV